MTQYNVNGTHLYVKSRGKGPHAFILHGGPGLSHEYMAAGLGPLERSLRCHYVDLTGQGRSGRLPAEELTHKRWVDDLEALRKAMGIEQAIVVGHSYGAFLGLEWATRYPDSICHLVLIDGGARMTPFAQVAANVEARRAEMPEAAATFLEGHYHDDASFRTWLTTVLPLYFRAAPPQAALDGLQAMRFDAVAGARFSTTASAFDVRADLHKVNAQTLVLHGRHDFILPAKMGQEIADGVAGAEMVVFEQTGHFPWWEEPERFWNELGGWFARKQEVLA